MDTLPPEFDFSQKNNTELAEITKNLPQINRVINQSDIEKTYILTMPDGMGENYRYNLIVLKKDKKSYIERLGGISDSRNVFGPIKQTIHK